ncbi:MAG: PAS domain S-box-containing protein [Myxococcota bacterium]|jgi:PAS domain S-box-containing protein
MGNRSPTQMPRIAPHPRRSVRWTLTAARRTSATAWLLVACLHLLTAVAYAEPSDKARVLMINSYHPQYEWTSELVRGVQDEFAGYIADERLYVEYMDGRRFVDDDDYQQRLTALYRHKYADFQPSVIISTDDYALLYLLANRDELFPVSPVIFSGVNALDPALLASRSQFTGIHEGMEIAGNVALIRQVHPEVERIIMLGDQTSFGQSMGARAHEVMAAHAQTADADRVTLELWDDFALPELYEQVAALDEHSVLLLLAIHKDNAGNYFSFSEDLPVLSERSAVPIYGMWGALLMGQGIVGGNLNDPYLHGRNAAAMAKRVLEGEDVSTIPAVPKAEYRPTFDYRQLRRFGISKHLLPPSARVEYRPVTFYTENRGLVWAIGATFSFLVAVIGLLAVSIANRHRAEASLRASEQKLSTHVQRSLLGVVEWDSGLVVSSWNPAAERIFGRSAAEALGTPLSEFFPAHRGEESEALLTRLGGTRSTAQHTRKDGAEVQCVWFHTHLVDADGAVIGLASMIEDVTERASLEAQLLQAQKMEAVGQLAGGVAHDFNNVLTVILGELELAEMNLRADTPATEVALARLDRAAAGGMRAADLIRQLLVFSRSDSSRPEVLDLGATLDEIRGMLHRIVPDVAVELERPAGAMEVLIDRGQFEQVVLNLAVNARDAMPSGGRLVFGLARVTASPGDERFPAPGPYVRLTATDTGEGMSEDTRRRAFEPFFTTKPPGEGTGLGLSTIFGLVAKWGGTIDIESELGVGTTLSLHLPAADPHDGTSADPRPSTSPPPVDGTESILLCEDDADIRDIVAIILGSAGYTVSTAADGVEALALLQSDGPGFDLLLTDVVMPNMGGRELVGRVRTERPELKVAFISGYTPGPASHEPRPIEGGPVLGKPFTRAALLELVRSVLDAPSGPPQA